MRNNTIKRVALISAPYHSGVVESAGTWLHLGFVYIAGSLRAAGYEVDYYDAMSLWHDWPAIRRRIEAFRPDVVATSVFTAAVPTGIKLLKLTKEINPECITVIGNVHATFMYDEMLQQHGDVIDFIIRGEGEITFPAWLDCLNAGDDPIKVQGLAFRRAGKTVVTPAAPFIQELDPLPLAWDLVEWPIYTYRAKNNARLAIVSSSRGCIQNCSFCSQKLFWQKTWRARSPENFVAELAMLHTRYGVEVAMLADEIPTLDPERWARILALLIQRKPGVKLLMETRVDDIIRDAGIMDQYRLAGVEHIYVGVEAGTQKRLDQFNKESKVERSKEAIDLIHGADIVSETSFVMGMPDETQASMDEVVELAKYYDPDMAFFLAIAPWPYADIYPTLAPYIATKDYGDYNLVKPVIQPEAMSLDAMEKALGMASKKFFLHKFQNLDKLTPWKRTFMLSVFDILINHSYLAREMKDMARKGGAQMPPEVKAMLRMVKEEKGKAGDGPIAPIP